MRRKYFHGSLIILAILLNACSSQKVGVYDDLNKSKMEKSFDKYMGTPYKWGGTEPGRGADCSGFTSGVYRDQGIIIPRTSRMQYTVGDEVSRDELQYGCANENSISFFESRLFYLFTIDKCSNGTAQILYEHLCIRCNDLGVFSRHHVFYKDHVEF